MTNEQIQHFDIDFFPASIDELAEYIAVHHPKRLDIAEELELLLEDYGNITVTSIDELAEITGCDAGELNVWDDDW